MTPDAPTPVLALGPELTINQAADCRDKLLEAMAGHSGDLALDLSTVTEFDSSAVQWLLAARRSLAEQSHRVHIVGASAAVHDALAVFGLQALLPVPA